ncbi:imidazole glycerol phosphate synthase subunit HisF [Candidatus Marinamargulisbacteria bacterium SCGC AG-343-K17]|nr:imidazole glycerol phosphate synthase subunit HisF [Candidatus Marinamargulisbacteria bacterium SCGC AG-343-K17]
MITKRIIPCLDVDQGRVVKGVNFVDIKDAGDPVELAKKYANDGADELVFLDITASSDKRLILTEMVERVAKEIFIPFTVGGGINSIEMIQDILNLGADKVSLNTAALHKPHFIQEAADHFGSQCIVVAVDIKRVISDHAPVFSDAPEYASLVSNAQTICEVYSHGGRHNLGLDALKWIKTCEDLGAGEILLTSMDRDGTKDGYDTDMLAKVKDLVSIPVIASGGAGSISHIQDALNVSDAALLASLLHYGTLTIQEIKRELTSNSIPIR